ncbi:MULTISPECIES: ABC transporter ATP-binding protein [Paenibacillus]|uniref:ABC transporter ATP-binding protein n=1 Tax=Paenibacillus TaxID=44249 RepID=UPI0008894ED0|nr:MULTISPECIES: ABC transporter ATP-binding protein [Paenibacillus]NTZ17992.1 ABC transporter ATP-binding protein [Paenibacillus sp. JMULE4]SDJ88662.1 NitT/TauT family transport system ATP-binding protein [Paenibacillus naphthalenovorans]
MTALAKLHTDNVSITYPLKNGEEITAVSGFNMTVNEGEFVCIVGPSGCGKSTMLGAIAGIQHVSDGKIYLNGQPIKGTGRDRGVVFQQASLFPWRTSLENVVYGLELAGVPKNERMAKGRELLKLVGLEAFEHHYPNQLSGGMQQRVNVARALAIEPSLMLLDEPLGALDAQTREFMQLELLRIWKETKQTIIFVTHDIGEAVYLSDRVVVMTARPGTVCETVDIHLPRPRPLEIKRSPEFLEYEKHIWGLIVSEKEREKQRMKIITL